MTSVSEEVSICNKRTASINKIHKQMHTLHASFAIPTNRNGLAVDFIRIACVVPATTTDIDKQESNKTTQQVWSGKM